MATCEYYVKKENGAGWVCTYQTADEKTVYERLAYAMASKYLWKSPNAGKITDRPDYATGNRIITVYTKAPWVGNSNRVYNFKEVFNVRL